MKRFVQVISTVIGVGSGIRKVVSKIVATVLVS